MHLEISEVSEGCFVRFFHVRLLQPILSGPAVSFRLWHQQFPGHLQILASTTSRWPIVPMV